MEVKFMAKYENNETHSLKVNLSDKDGQTITDGFVIASRAAATMSNSPITMITRCTNED